MPLFVKLSVVWQIGFGHKTQQTPAGDHGGTVVQLAMQQKGQPHQGHQVQAGAGAQNLVQRIQCALLQGALQKQVAAGVARKA